MSNFFKSLEQFFSFLGPAAPWLIALLIILLGSILVKILEKLIKKCFNKINIDERVNKLIGGNSSLEFGNGISKLIYYLLLLVVVYFALTATGNSEVVEPLKSIFSKIFQFSMSIITAGVIIFISWIIATLVKKILLALILSSKVDEKLNLGDKKPIANTLSSLAFFSIILVMLPTALTALKMSSVSEPIKDIISSIFNYIPSLFSGILLVAIGYLIASNVQKIVANLLSSVGADSLLAKLGYKGGNLFGISLSLLLSYVAMTTVLVILGSQAILVMKLDFISDMAHKFVPGYFDILTSLFIVGFAIYLGNIIGQLIGAKSAFWAKIVKFSIFFFLGAVALQKANISSLTNDTFQLIIQSLIIGSAFALGVGGAIALGLGGREKVKDFLNKKFK